MRIFVCSAYSYWNWEPPDMFEPSENMVAGGETASVNLAVQLAARGHEVFYFHGSLKPRRYKGVDFLPKSYARQMVPHMHGDVLIAWEDMDAVAWNHECDLVVLAMQTNFMQMGALDWGVDYYQAVSKWHVETLLRSDQTLPERAREKFVIFPNGVNMERYDQEIERVPGRVVYSSSPDRGLHHLLAIWPEIRKRVPHATLRIFYDMKKWLAIVEDQYAQGYVLNTTERAFAVRDGIAANAENGVEYVGAVGQWRLAQEQLAAELLCYPCDTVDHATEGFGITVLEGMAAGTPVLTTDEDAFGELWKGAAEMIKMPFDGKESVWADNVVRLLTNKKAWQSRSKKGLKKVETLTWGVIGEKYETWMVGALERKRAELAQQGERVTT